MQEPYYVSDCVDVSAVVHLKVDSRRTVVSCMLHVLANWHLLSPFWLSTGT